MNPSEFEQLRRLMANELSENEAQSLNSQIFSGKSEFSHYFSDGNSTRFSAIVVGSLLADPKNAKYAAKRLLALSSLSQQNDNLPEAIEYALQAKAKAESSDELHELALSAHLHLAVLRVNEDDLGELRSCMKKFADYSANTSNLPPWKLILGVAGVLKDGKQIPRETYDGILSLALDEYRRFPWPKEKTNLKMLVGRIATRWFPRLFDFVPIKYDEVRLLMRLAENSFRIGYHYSVFKYSDDAHELGTSLLVYGQAEHACLLSDHATNIFWSAIAMRDADRQAQARKLCLESKQLAEGNRKLPHSSVRYCSIINNFLMIGYVLHIQSKNLESTSLQSLLNRLRTTHDELNQDSPEAVSLAKEIAGNISRIEQGKIDVQTVRASVSYQWTG